HEYFFDVPFGYETTGAAALAREADTPRLRCADPADLGTRESVWPIRSRHEYAIGVAVIEMAPGDTTVGSTPAPRLRNTSANSARGSTVAPTCAVAPTLRSSRSRRLVPHTTPFLPHP